MKLYLASLKTDGKLMFKDHIPYSPKMIATITNHNIAIVEQAFTKFTQLGLIEILDDGAIFMLDIENFIGRSSSEGDRKREYRKRIDDEKHKLLLGGQMSDKRPPEIETEIEIEIEIEIELDKEIPYEEIIDYLNLKAKTNYKATLKNTQDLIKVKWDESFTLKDFKIVIDKKTAEWLGSKWEKYLRPKTLFSDKFEEYLNANIIKPKELRNQFNDYQQRTYDFDLLEKRLLGWSNK
jgi:uncharacterized phage protein (TIGR02220 family)/predicted phage replisome organizer